MDWKRAHDLEAGDVISVSTTEQRLIVVDLNLRYGMLEVSCRAAERSADDALYPITLRLQPQQVIRILHS